MPPFRAGLLKRKSSPEDSKNTGLTTSNKESDAESDEDLIQGEINGDDDVTDSERENNESDSEEEEDKVLFEDSADSTFGENEEEGSDSSELTDSEADAESDDEESENDDETSDKESSDSGDESGIGKSESSDVDTKKTEGKKLKDKKKSAKDGIDVLAEKIKETNVNIKPIEQKDEYESGDTSDEEDRINTAGDVPMWWYKEYPHVGYDLDGKRIMKPPQRDAIDDFLKQCEDPEFWRTVRDPATGQEIVLSKKDLELIARIRGSQVPNAEHDEYQPWVEWFSREVLATPVRAFPDHKRSFLPSRSDQLQIAKLVHALKMGWTKTRKQIADERRKRKERNFYNLWGPRSAEEEERLRGVHKPIAAPKRPLPSHAESYNPPPEYLLDHKEMKEWNKLKETPWKRKYTFLPTQFCSLRAVPAYDRYIRERFLRCLDLYLAPRAIKMRLTISPSDLVPKLPSPRDLQPFPTSEALVFRSHEALVRSVDFDPSGQYALSGSDDGTVKVWESSTGRCLRTIALGGRVVRVAWTPVKGLSLVAAAVGRRLVLLNPGPRIGAHRVAEHTDALLEEPPPQHASMDERTSSCVKWERVKPEEWANGVRIAVDHFKPVIHVAWHARGDYLAVTLEQGASRSVVVHQVSRRRSQLPFAKAKGHVQAAIFHPHRPHLFVATQRVVRVYDLVKQELVRKLLTGAQWISSLAIHPAGDNLLVASYDRKLIWFDLELSSKPYQTLRLHGGAVRGVAFHPRYPLFASAGDDPKLLVSHGMVYNDLLQNPLLVPLKQLGGPPQVEQLCVLDVRFHPSQPWLLAAAADHTLRLYS